MLCICNCAPQLLTFSFCQKCWSLYIWVYREGILTVTLHNLLANSETSLNIAKLWKLQAKTSTWHSISNPILNQSLNAALRRVGSGASPPAFNASSTTSYYVIWGKWQMLSISQLFICKVKITVTVLTSWEFVEKSRTQCGLRAL